jgi:tetratricopeptide (TPR) repeat protein
VPALQLLTAFPHVTLATFGRWDELLAEPLPAPELRLARGLAWYARGLAQAARRRPADAAASLDSVRAAAAAVTDAPGAPVLAIATRTLAAEIAARRGDTGTAVAELREAMRLEDGLSYMEPPYWHQPVRHRLGEALLAAGRPAEAARLFEEDLARFPENVWALRGLERTLAARGDRAGAAAARARYARAARGADVTLTSSRF